MKIKYLSTNAYFILVVAVNLSAVYLHQNTCMFIDVNWSPRNEESSSRLNFLRLQKMLLSASKQQLGTAPVATPAFLLL